VAIIVHKERESTGTSIPNTHFPSKITMVIIATFNKFITKSLLSGNVFTHLAPKGCRNCPYEGMMHRHGFYTRSVITCLQYFEIYVPRFICPKCGKTYSKLPCFLIPYYRYSYDFILASLYYLFVLKLPACKIPSIFNETNPHCYISLQSILLFKKRFLKDMHKINNVFTYYNDFYYSMDLSQLSLCQAASAIILKIVKFDLVHNFNTEYFKNTSDHLFCK